MNFEFNVQPSPQSLLEVPDILNCAIEGINDDGYFYYYVIKSTLGTSTIVKCGPVVPEVTMLPSGFSTSLNRCKADEDKIRVDISKWLNGKSGITSARVITVEEALDEFRDLRTYMLNYSDEVY